MTSDGEAQRLADLCDRAGTSCASGLLRIIDNLRAQIPAHKPVYDINNARDECEECCTPWPCQFAADGEVAADLRAANVALRRARDLADKWAAAAARKDDASILIGVAADLLGAALDLRAVRGES